MSHTPIVVVLGSAVLPLLAGASPETAMAVLPQGSPDWLPWVLAVITPGCTWALGSVAAILAKMAAAWLRSSAAAARARAAKTADPADDAAAEAEAKAKEAAADEIDKRAGALGGQKA